MYEPQIIEKMKNRIKITVKPPAEGEGWELAAYDAVISLGKKYNVHVSTEKIGKKTIYILEGENEKIEQLIRTVPEIR